MPTPRNIMYSIHRPRAGRPAQVRGRRRRGSQRISHEDLAPLLPTPSRLVVSPIGQFTSSSHPRAPAFRSIPLVCDLAVHGPASLGRARPHGPVTSLALRPRAAPSGVPCAVRRASSAAHGGAALQLESHTECGSSKPSGTPSQPDSAFLNLIW